MYSVLILNELLCLAIGCYADCVVVELSVKQYSTFTKMHCSKIANTWVSFKIPLVSVTPVIRPYDRCQYEHLRITLLHQPTRRGMLRVSVRRWNMAQR